MTKTLLVYNSKGEFVISLNDVNEDSYGVRVFDVPDNKILVGVDPETKEPIFEDREPTVEERLSALEESQDVQDGAIMDLAEIISEE